MSDTLSMTFDTDGPGGVPGALRSAAAVYPTVTIPARMALRIARDLEGLAAARCALQTTNLAVDAVQDSVARVERQMRGFGLLMFWLGAGVGALIVVLA